MIRLASATLASLVSVLVVACSTEQPSGATTGSGGTVTAIGGTTAQTSSGGTLQSSATGGATSSANGGISGAVGGNSAATGGVNASGGSPSTGGTNNASGGSPSTGGVNATRGGSTGVGGGSPATGGSNGTSVGGASTGGRLAIGGASTGGRLATGGASTGGALGITAIGGTHSGEATFYTPNGNGNCSFGTAVSGLDIAALNQPDYNMAAWCGACADVTGPLGTVRVLIQDRCPECASGDLDLNPEAFDKIALHSAGRVAITWKFVPCDVTGPVQYHFKDGSSTGWVAVQVLNHRLPVVTLEYSIDGGTTYKPTVRQEYNYFLEANGFGPNVVFVRITAVTGQQLIDTLPFASSDTTIDGQTNF